MLKLKENYDKEKLELAREKLRNFQKEMREVGLKNLDEIQEEFITYIKAKKIDITLEQMDLINEVFEFQRNKIKK